MAMHSMDDLVTSWCAGCVDSDGGAQYDRACRRTKFLSKRKEQFERRQGRAEERLRRLDTLSLEPDVSTFNSVMDACART